MTLTEKQRLTGRVVAMLMLASLAYLNQFLPKLWFPLLFLLLWVPKIIQLVIRHFHWAKEILIHPTNILNYSESRTLLFKLPKETTFDKLVEVLEQNQWVIPYQNPSTGEINVRTKRAIFGDNIYLKLKDRHSETRVTLDWVDFRPWGNPSYRNSKITTLINQFEDSLTI